MPRRKTTTKQLHLRVGPPSLARIARLRRAFHGRTTSGAIRTALELADVLVQLEQTGWELTIRPTEGLTPTPFRIVPIEGKPAPEWMKGKHSAILDGDGLDAVEQAESP